MKNRSTLLLMEQVIMVMFFSIAAVLCVQIFVYAHRTSVRNSMRTEAIATVQSYAEELKNTQGNYEGLAQAYDGNWNGNTLEITDKDTAYTVCITPIESGSDLLGIAELKAVAAEDTLFVLQAGWQEAGS